MPSPVRFAVVKKLLEEKRKKRAEKDPLRRPFNRRVMQRARAIASQYQITLWREDGEWFGCGVEEPGAMGDGRTVAQCVKSVREALSVCVAYLIESGGEVVTPIIDRERSRRKAG